MLTDEQRQNLIDQFENDTWDWRDWEGMHDPAQPVFIMVPLSPSTVPQLDEKAGSLGKTRDEFVEELIEAALA